MVYMTEFPNTACKETRLFSSVAQGKKIQEETNMSQSSVQILVIEHDRQLQELLNERLIAAGFQVVCANNGMIGLGMVQQCQPDLILSDTDMPEMAGYERIIYPLSCAQVQQTPFLFRKAIHRKQARTSSFKIQSSQTDPEAMVTHCFESGDVYRLPTVVN
jgi:CheY-like chemotaxis protein